MTLSPALVDAQLFFLDVAGGGDVARKGGPGIARADLLIINKIDLGPHIDVDVEQMVADATAARDGGPVLPLSRKQPETVKALCDWVRELHAAHAAGDHPPIDPGQWCRIIMPTRTGMRIHMTEAIRNTVIAR